MSGKFQRVRLIAAEGAALVTLVAALLYALAFYDRGLAAYSGRGPTVIAIVLGVAAFALSMRIRSPAIAGMLVVGGVAMQIPPVQAISEAGAVVFPGPILGVVFFAPVMVLGVVKALAAWRAKPAPT